MTATLHFEMRADTASGGADTCTVNVHWFGGQDVSLGNFTTLPASPSSDSPWQAYEVDVTDYYSETKLNRAEFTKVGGSDDAHIRNVWLVAPFVFGSWDFEVNRDGPEMWLPLDETGGTVAIDSTGHGHSLSGFGGYVWGELPLDRSGVGHSVQFPSGNVYFQDTIYSWWANSPSITVEAWIKTSAVGETMNIIDRDDLYLSNHRVFQFRVWGDNLEFILVPEFGYPPVPLAGTTPVNDGVEHHVAATVEDLGTVRRIRIFVDGYIDGETTTTQDLPQNAALLRVGISGAHPFNLVQPYHGWIDDPLLYLHALTPDRVAKHAGAGLRDFGQFPRTFPYTQDVQDGLINGYVGSSGTTVLNDGGSVGYAHFAQVGTLDRQYSMETLSVVAQSPVTWFFGADAARPYLRQRQRDDAKVSRVHRRGNEPTSRQYSLRQGPRGTYL